LSLSKGRKAQAEVDAYAFLCAFVRDFYDTLSTIKPNMHFKPRYLIIALVIFVLEVLVATTFAAVPFIRGSISDILVVALIYYLILAFVRVHEVALALGVLLFAYAVEVGQYFRIADVLGFERGSLMSILIGTTFSWEDLLMYLLGCVLALLSHRYLSQRRHARQEHV
jgi:hypothetical protein